MSELVSIVVPLQTFPGWPTAPEHSIVTFLMVIVVIPVVAGGVIGLLALGGALARRGRGGSARGKDPVWLGHTGSAKAIASDATSDVTGGSSARW